MKPENLGRGGESTEKARGLAVDEGQILVMCKKDAVVLET